jgi:hypothetical protein
VAEEWIGNSFVSFVFTLSGLAIAVPTCHNTAANGACMGQTPLFILFRVLAPVFGCGMLFYAPTLHAGAVTAIQEIPSSAAIREELPLPQSPTQFNPDAGSQKLIPSEPFFRRDPILPPVYGDDLVPSELALPRKGVKIEPRLESDFHSMEYEGHEKIPSYARREGDRWRIGFGTNVRYADRATETPFMYPTPNLWHPYRQSVLKGDLPLFGPDIFLSVTAQNQFESEFRALPTPSNVSGARPTNGEFYGRGDSFFISNTTSVIFDLFEGEAAFKPVEWLFHFNLAHNLNYVEGSETGGVSPDPRGSGHKTNNSTFLSGAPPVNPTDLLNFYNNTLKPASSDTSGKGSYTSRLRSDLALQEAFAEVHLSDLSDNYDFIATRLGMQFFNSDFRGFIFNTTDLGARIFGNLENNQLQYNAVFFDMREKDTNSGLNTLNERNQRVIVANAYYQDFLTKGYTAQLSFHANFDDASRHYDKNGFIVRPSPIGTVADHSLDSYYLGWSGDGHIDWLNISHSFYQVLGEDRFNGIAGHSVDINAQMAALELSVDKDWQRYKASFFYASGDDRPNDKTATGFDSIFDNPLFIASPFSYYLRQGFNLGGTSVAFKQANSLVPNLRTSKSEGQSNFVNPGVFIAGLGAEYELTPKLRMLTNANYIRMVSTAPIKEVLLTNEVDDELGYDLSMGFQYRPLLTDQIIMSAGGGVFIPGTGFEDIYRTSPTPVPGFSRTSQGGRVDDPLYSCIMTLTLTY